MSEGYEGRRRGRGISTDSRRTAIKKKEGKEMGEKREERANAFSPENMSYLRDEGGGRRRGGGQAGQREERRAFFFFFFSRQQNFLQPPTATSQALFFRFGFRRSWRVAWSASFRCRL